MVRFSEIAYQRPDMDALKDAAKADGVSLSAKTAEILAEWAKQKTNNE